MTTILKDGSSEDYEEVILSDGKSYITVKVDSKNANILRSDHAKAHEYFHKIQELIPATSHTLQTAVEQIVEDNDVIEPPDNIEPAEDANLKTEDDDNTWAKRSCITSLIKLRKEADEQFVNPRCKRKELWENIAKEMSTQGYQMKGQSCMKKFSNLIITYRRIQIQAKSATGKTKSSWIYYDLMNDFMNKKDQPPPESFIVSSILPKNKNEKNSKAENESEDSDSNGLSSENSLKKRKLKDRSDETSSWIKGYLERKEKAAENREKDRQKFREKKLEGLSKLINSLEKLADKI